MIISISKLEDTSKDLLANPSEESEGAMSDESGGGGSSAEGEGKDEATLVPEEVVEASEGKDGDESDSLNSQINLTIKEIQTNLQVEEKEDQGVAMTEENVDTLVGNLWPSVQNFVEESLGEVSTLDAMAVDEITEEEAAYIRSRTSL
jgi:hypothetical protein